MELVPEIEAQFPDVARTEIVSFCFLISLESLPTLSS